jgi:geranylgeranyl reductase family protein
MIKTDVVVVGAGPSGCAAASILAENGLKITLIDRATFPRDKVCGDVASPLALSCLRRLGLGPWIDAGSFVRPSRLVLRFPAGQTVEVEQGPELPSLGTVIPRRQLDQALLEHTLAKGITFLDETKALGATIGRQGVTVECVHRDRLFSVQAKVVLAGDGSTAPFSRRLGLVRGRSNVFAARTYVRGDRLDADAYHVFFLPNLLPSYGWIFPVAPGLFNVGVGMPTSRLRKGGTKLKPVLDDLLSSQCARQVIGTCRQVEPVRAAALRMPGLHPNRLAAERTLTMGDAASMPNPLSGEGIGPALDSGMIAAEHVCRAFQSGVFSQECLSSYSVEVQRKYGEDYRAASILCTLLARPFISNGAANLARSEPKFARMLAKAVLSQSAKQVLLPSTLLRSSLYWAPRAMLQGLGKSERVT